MSEDIITGSIRKLPLAAAFVALLGVGDTVYLTIKHYTDEPVPCSLLAGCETVLTSSYATIGDVPLAALGAAAYFVAFSLAVLAAYGNRIAWTLFSIQATGMALFSVWLIYVQARLIGAFCQFCLLSAATSFTLFILAAISRFKRS